MSHCEIHNQSSRRGKTVVLWLGVLQDHIVLYLNIAQSLIEFGMSVDGPHMYHNEKRCIHTLDQVQSEPGLYTETGTEASLRVGFSPGSIVSISWGRTDS